MKQRVFRIAWSEIENTIARKPFDQVNKKKFRYSHPIVETPENVRSYKEVVADMKKTCPQLHHWLDFSQPDENGLFPYGNRINVFILKGRQATKWATGEKENVHGSIRDIRKQLAKKHGTPVVLFKHKDLHEAANQTEG